MGRIVAKAPKVLVEQMATLIERKKVLLTLVKPEKLDMAVSKQPDLLVCNPRFLYGGSGD